MGDGTPRGRARQGATRPDRESGRERVGPILCADATRAPSRRVTLEELRSRIAAGEIDTVLLAMCDMQGRLQGKRLTASHFLDEVLEHGAEGCNYLLAVDVEMNTVAGYEMSSWDTGYGDFQLVPDLDTLRLVPWQEATALVMCDLRWADGTDVAASPRQILRAAADAAGRATAGRPTPRPSSSSWSFATRMRPPGTRVFASSSRPTSTTSTIRCWAPRGSSR